MTPHTLILGLGNVLMTDEAVGAEVAGRLAAQFELDDSVLCLDGGTLSFTLATPIGECRRLIVVDAAAMGEPPGTVRLFEGESMDQRLRNNAKTVHEVSLADLMDMARLTDSLPAWRALVGIEPARIDWGEHLTPEVEAAVPRAIELIHALLARWASDDSAVDRRV